MSVSNALDTIHQELLTIQVDFNIIRSATYRRRLTWPRQQSPLLLYMKP